MNNKKLISEIRGLGKLHNVKVIFFNEDRDCAGHIDTGSDKYIYIWKKYLYSRHSIVSTFFHELGHIHCIRTNRWRAYHLNYKDMKNEITIEEFYKKNLYTGLKAERWVDKWAKNMVNKYDRNIKYIDGYKSEVNINWFRNTTTNTIKKLLNNLKK